MPSSRRPTAAQIRDRRARIALIAGGALLLVVGFIQGPSLFKSLSGSKSSSTVVAAPTTTPGAVAVATISPSSAMAGGQLFKLRLLKPHISPFESQMPTTPAASGTTTTAAPPAPAKAAAPATTSTPAATQPATTAATTTTPVPTTPVPTTPVSTTPVSTTPVSTTPVSTTPVSTSPITFTAPTGVIAAVVKVNGKRQLIGIDGMFPAKAPLFKLVSFKGKQARIKVVGGSFSSGRAYLLIPPGRKMTFLNESDGSRFVVLFVKTTHAPQENLSSPTTDTTAGATTPGATTTSAPPATAAASADAPAAVPATTPSG